MSMAGWIELGVRCLLVVLFLPFSALDKLLNFRAAVAQAQEVVPSAALAKLFLLGGFAIEVIMSLAILTGFADRAAALVLGAYCIATAVGWKRFWQPGDFWQRGKSRARDIFWDFLKNFSLAGGFFLLAFGATQSDVERFLAAPFASSNPYASFSQSEHP